MTEEKEKPFQKSNYVNLSPLLILQSGPWGKKNP